MSTLTKKLKHLLTQGKGTEQRIANYLLENSENIVSMNVAELATKANVSSASVIRFSRQMGYSGYPEFKVDYLLEEKQQKTSGNILYGNLEKTDTTKQIISKTGNLFTTAIQDSLALLDADVIDALAKNMVSAKRIVLFGIGASAVVASDIFHKLIRVNKNTLFSPDLHAQLAYSANLSSEDMAIAVTARGNTTDINRMLKSAKNEGCLTVALTRFGQDEATRLADYTLPYFYDEQHSQLGVITPQVLQMIAFDVLFFKYLTQVSESAENALLKGREAVMQGNQ
ncbi:MurR/RpiR family transcriptional regulator [Proteus myxofaciens]|uniref:RpiR family transcriptional regulator n=1 Tax=Proteus myxofaciens ATCC 19692 TaxID=1354337 RepID=A0A198FPX2_9GAMM|nr:MurR/RpiR family transcriptional regulator [Proteus myxofaciens]OAT26918.1 RpiR family transcriptional regulator [Proteus myxofaciens ATCC 19692]